MDSLAADSRPICPWCRQPFIPRKGGKPQRFCSAAHRLAAWVEARRQAFSRVGGAADAQNNAQSNKHVAGEGTASSPAPQPTHPDGCRWCGSAVPLRAIGRGRPRSDYCSSDCRNSFHTALRWAGWEALEGGSLTMERLKEIDHRWRAAAAVEEAEREQARQDREVCRRPRAKIRPLSAQRRAIARFEQKRGAGELAAKEGEDREDRKP